MELRCLVSLLVLSPCSFIPAGEEPGKDAKPVWLAITRPGFTEALKPLSEMREKEGFRAMVSTRPVEQALAALGRRPAFILLVGDDEPGKEREPWYVPARRMKFYRWMKHQREEFASDLAWGDLDGDLLPDVPVGRLPVRTSRDIETIVKKILAYEGKEPSLDDLRLPIWAGAPGYGPLVDSVTTGLLLNIVQFSAPAWVRQWLISGDPRQALCGWPEDQAALFTGELKRGGILAGLMGHGLADSFHSMVFGRKYIDYTAEDAAGACAAGDPAPPLVIFACSCGNFARPRPCLAESLLLMGGGPVAAIAATSESHPLPNFYSGQCCLEALGGKERRLGSLWLSAQRAAQKARNVLVEGALRDAEGSLEPKIDIDRLKRVQMLLYAILGDPATRLRLPEPLPSTVRFSGGEWRWEVQRPGDARVLFVGLRPAGQSYPQVKGELEKEDARRNFQAANGIHEFRALPSPSEGEPWKGTVKEEGVLRLVATGPGKIYAAAHALKRPSPAPDEARPETGR